MIQFKELEQSLSILFETKDLSQKQVRLLKRCLTTLALTVQTKDESDYFEGSSDLLKLVTALIKESNFPKRSDINQAIPYTEQVLEYSIEELHDFLSSGDPLYDN